MTPEYKKVKVIKPHCHICKEMLTGNNSMMLPYQCKCGMWKWDFSKLEFNVSK